MDEKKLYLNIQEQVEKNKEDIKHIQLGGVTLGEFGIHVIGHVDLATELPDAATYPGDFGDAYTVGYEAPYDFYIFTRPDPDNEEDDPYWFNIGVFPAPGPQGPAGEDGVGIASIAKTATSGLIDTYTITYTDGSTANFYVKNGANGARGPQGNPGVDGHSPVVTISSDGFWVIDGVETDSPSRGPQGEAGDPGAFFILAGQVTSDTLLPAASEVDANKAYLVGASAPYDVYAILSVGEDQTHYWINLGPVAVQQSDTKVGSLTFTTSGTLSPEVLAEISNTTTADFIKIGDRYFVKQSAGNYYALKRDSGQVLVYCMAIDFQTGEWVITTETMCDLDSDQTITGAKEIKTDLTLQADSGDSPALIFQRGTPTDTSGDMKIYDSAGKLRIDSRYGSASWSYVYEIGTNGILPFGDNTKDLGSTSNQSFKDIVFKGKLKDGTNSLSLADIAGSTFNVINASDIVSNTLTQAQYDLITNGKPTLIKGSILSFTNPFIVAVYSTTNDLYLLYWSERYLRCFNITKSTRVMTVSGGKIISLNNINDVNGKQIPSYPTTNASPQVLTIAANGGALSWETPGTAVHLYEHVIKISGRSQGECEVLFSYISASATQTTSVSDIYAAIGSGARPCSGDAYDSVEQSQFKPTGINFSTSSYFIVFNEVGGESVTLYQADLQGITDTVRTIY